MEYVCMKEIIVVRQGMHVESAARTTMKMN